MQVYIPSLVLALLVLGSLVPIVPSSFAGNTQNMMSSTIDLEILDVNASQYSTYAGATIGIVVTVNASWDVFDFSSFLVEAYYDDQLIGSQVYFVLDKGQDIIRLTFVWDTSGVELGFHTISAKAYGSNIDTYFDGSVQIFPVGNVNTKEGYATIQEAINNANEGDTIFVRNGTYYENLVIQKAISLIGENRESTIIDANRTGTVFLISNSMGIVKIDGFTIQNSGLEYYAGIYCSYASCQIENNNIRNNLVGVLSYGSSNNIITKNNLEGNTGNGISLSSSSGNVITHNSFVNNANQVYIYQSSNNTWHEAYPSGGNYWSDYSGTDAYSGPYQNETASDGIGDTPYVIDANNLDNYPLMNPWAPPDIAVSALSTSKTIIGQGYTGPVNVTLENQGNKIEELNATFYANETFIGSQTFMLTSNVSIIYSSDWNLSSLPKGNYSLSVRIVPLEGETDLNDNSINGKWIFITIPGDLNGDKTVDIYDAIMLADHFGLGRYHVYWDPNFDINNDGIIDIYDAIILAANYGKSWT